MDKAGLPFRCIITAGIVVDCTKASELLKGLKAEVLFDGCVFDTNEILEYAANRGIRTIFPPKINRKVQRHYDKDLYKFCHLVENAFFKLKRWRDVATRYAKN